MGRIKSSGTISINDIRNEFGASGSPDMAEYRRGGTNATRVHSYGYGHNTNIGTSQVSLSQYYNAHRGWYLTVGSSGIYRGYSNGSISGIASFGSINPTNYRGATVKGIMTLQFTFKGNTTRTHIVTLSGYRARNWFTRYYDASHGSLYTSSASWSPNNTQTAWSWTVGSYGQYNTIGANISPEMFQ